MKGTYYVAAAMIINLILVPIVYEMCESRRT